MDNGCTQRNDGCRVSCLSGGDIKLLRVENLGKRSFPFAGRKMGWQFPFHNSPLSVRRIRKLWPYFLFYLSERVEEIRPMGSGSTYPEVSRGKFRELEVISPKHSLVTAFCEQAKDMLKRIGFLKQQNRKLRDGRDLLLPRLMSEEIAV